MEQYEAVKKIMVAYTAALRVAEANKAAGSPISSTAYDSGRVAGLKEALEIMGVCDDGGGRANNIS